MENGVVPSSLWLTPRPDGARARCRFPAEERWLHRKQNRAEHLSSLTDEQTRLTRLLKLLTEKIKFKTAARLPPLPLRLLRYVSYRNRRLVLYPLPLRRGRSSRPKMCP